MKLIARLARYRSVVAAIIVAGSTIAILSACSAVLGFESLALLPAEGGPSNVEGGITEDGSSKDGTPDDGSSDAPGCVADLSRDSKNCGRCNHDCLGGACEMSQCRPIKLADGLADAEGLVVGPNDVFVAEHDLNRIARFGKGGLGPCVAPPLPQSCVFTSTNAFRPTAMGIDGNSVYWLSAGDRQIRSCPIAGCASQTPTLIATTGDLDHSNGGGYVPLDLVIKDAQVFWSENTGGAVSSAPVAGGTVTTYLDSTSGTYAPVAIAVDDTQIFFTEDLGSGGVKISAVPRSASKVARLVSDPPARPYGIALTAGGNLYWTVPFQTMDGDGVVQAAPKTASGGAPVGAVATQQYDPRAIMVDAANVYWLVTGDTTTESGLVVYCPQSGCPSGGPIVLASNQRVPKHITQDDKAIYWSNEGLVSSPTYNGQVWKVAKP